MRIPFLSRFIDSNRWESPFLEMEEVTDKTCREFLRNPTEDANELSNNIGGEINKVTDVLKQLEEHLPVFYKMCLYLREHPQANAKEISQNNSCCVEYGRALLEIRENQDLEI
jgi:hypothetical protein